jgi:hypothetical protein
MRGVGTPPTNLRLDLDVGCSMLDVGCSRSPNQAGLSEAGYNFFPEKKSNLGLLSYMCRTYALHPDEYAAKNFQR